MTNTNPSHRNKAATRRQFMQFGGAAALACAAQGMRSAVAAEETAAPHPSGKHLTLGVASYSFRTFDLDKTIAMTKRSGATHINMKAMHLPLDAQPEALAAIVAKVAAAGLKLYGAGVIDMSKESQVAQAFEYGKAAGLSVLVISCAPALLPLIEQQVKKYDIRVGIHNHGPGDKRFPSPQSVYEKVESLDRRVGLCIDIGHTVRVGADLVQSIEKYGDRLYDMHIKDVTEATAKGKCIQLGRGVIDIPGMLRALVKINYQGVLSYEYEAEEKDPLPGLCECVGYTKGVLAVI